MKTRLEKRWPDWRACIHEQLEGFRQQLPPGVTGNTNMVILACLRELLEMANDAEKGRNHHRPNTGPE